VNAEGGEDFLGGNSFRDQKTIPGGGTQKTNGKVFCLGPGKASWGAAQFGIVCGLSGENLREPGGIRFPKEGDPGWEGKERHRAKRTNPREERTTPGDHPDHPFKREKTYQRNPGNSFIPKKKSGKTFINHGRGQKDPLRTYWRQ